MSTAQEKAGTGTQRQTVDRIVYEVKGWVPPDKVIAFSRWLVQVDITYESREKSISKEVGFAVDRFDAMANKVHEIRFFDLPRAFFSYVDGNYETVKVYTDQGLSKEVSIAPGAKLPTGLREFVDLLSKTAQEIEPVYFSN